MADSYRSVMEVLKWVELKHTLNEAALVNKRFQAVSDSDELWHSYIELEGLNLDHLSLRPLKLKDGFKMLHRSIRSRIVFCTGSSLRVFNCASETIIKTCPIDNLSPDNFSVVVFISPNELFLCGGGEECTDALVYNIETLALRKLRSMRYPRYLHASIFRRGQVYVFGGELSPETAEKYMISAQKWTQLSDMITGRSSFTVCAQGDLIYLCGGFTVSCETFNCETEAFHQLRFTLEQPGSTCVFLYENEVICGNSAKLYYVNSERKVQRLPEMLEGVDRWSYMNPVVAGHYIFSPIFEDNERFLRIDMTSFQCIVKSAVG